MTLKTFEPVAGALGVRITKHSEDFSLQQPQKKAGATAWFGNWWRLPDRSVCCWRRML